MKTFLLTILIIAIGFFLFLYWERKSKRDEKKSVKKLREEMDRLLEPEWDEMEKAISN